MGCICLETTHVVSRQHVSDDEDQMPSANDLKGFKRMQQSALSDDSLKLVANMPEFPPDLKKRFPSMEKHEQEVKEWNKKLIIALRGGN